ncbi:STM4015 family protein [Nocardiopsis sp. MG754419]|uniref:STM4015 family protein n=1 Tax=Nocardiopsis sp. MG754419 TaxID=2259865 RepID=UPI001BA86F4D|nr:STM4015 family protein [Nocardiopsis sp. MG754419]MBR8742303.1 hypothetical protein [Nocardiopsis sp. MG754419]
MISEHLTEYAGLPVVDFLSAGAEEHRLQRATWHARRAGEEAPTSTPHRERMERAITDPGAVAWALRLEPGAEDFAPYLRRFVAEVDTARVTALVIGDWGLHDGSDVPSTVVRDALVEHAAAFPGLRSLFFGDITVEENEISWIQQTDLAPLLAAYPRLRELTVRGVGETYQGASILALRVPEHAELRSLTLQSGGLPGRVVREVASSGLPALESLELWLGVDHYGGDAAPADLEPLLTGTTVPHLRHLGLRNAQDTGLWLRALVASPLLERLTSVDLSMGTLRGRDVDHLLASVPALSHLKSLDLHHHYLSEEQSARVRDAFAGTGVVVDLADRREPEHYGDGDDVHYPSVTE